MANLQVSKTSAADALRPVLESTASISAKKPVIVPTIQAPEDLKKQIALYKINSVLDKPYLKTNITKKDDGKYYLTITRPSEDKDRPNREAYDNISMDNFKRALGLKKYVIKNCKYNDSYTITKRREWSDNATMEKGTTLTIPLEELGQEWYLFGGGDNKLLRQAVQEYQR